MKPVQIDFVAPRAWKLIWALGAVAVLGVAITTGWQVWQLAQLRQAMQSELNQLQAERQQQLAKQKPEAPEVNPRANSELAAQRLLQRDWNALFDTLENTQLPGARLVHLNMDAGSGQARVEYELEGMEQGAALTVALNAANGGIAVWRLERLSGGAVGNGAGGGYSGAKVRGVWAAQLPYGLGLLSGLTRPSAS
jgi:hypothetical protein